MNLSKRFWFLSGAAAVALIALPVAAIASHGKAGLWSVTVTIAMAGMPQMPQMSPEQMEKMKEMGMQMPEMGGRTITTQHCMTADEVNSNNPPPMRDHDCTMSNIQIAGQTFSADMTCTGRMQGSGHMTVSYDSTEHYTGTMTFSGTEQGHQANVTNNFEGHWVSADCGSVH